jgi:hypothetical protein
MKVRLLNFFYGSLFGAAVRSLWVFGANQGQPESIAVVALILGLFYAVIGQRFWAIFNGIC